MQIVKTLRQDAGPNFVVSRAGVVAAMFMQLIGYQLQLIVKPKVTVRKINVRTLKCIGSCIYVDGKC